MHEGLAAVVVKILQPSNILVDTRVVLGGKDLQHVHDWGEHRNGVITKPLDGEPCWHAAYELRAVTVMRGFCPFLPCDFGHRSK